ncbi:MAG: S8 family serine peptidase [Pyrinomonadaceae bacterium]
MKLPALTAALVLFLVSTSSFISAAKDNKIRPAADPIPGRYIVVLKTDASTLAETSVPDTIGLLSSSYAIQPEHVYESAFAGFSVKMTRDEASLLSEDPRVAYVEEDSYVTAAQGEQTSPGWGLDRIDQRALPYDNIYNFPGTGAGVNVYLLDSGILTSHIQE